MENTFNFGSDILGDRKSYKLISLYEIYVVYLVLQVCSVHI